MRTARALTQLETFARAGYAARAVVYLMLGYLGLASSRAEGTSTVLGDLKALPGGEGVLALTALGLLGYAVFRIYGAARDLDGDGSGAKGIARRVGLVISGVAHLVLCFLAVRLLLAGAESGGGGGPAEMARATPGGSLLFLLAAAGLAVAAGEQAVKAATAKFMELLVADAPPIAEASGRIGYGARAVVFAILAWQALRAGLGSNDGDVSFEAALGALRATGWGFTLVAAGLLVFGVFNLIMARYARIRNEDLLARVRSGRRRLF